MEGPDPEKCHFAEKCRKSTPEPDFHQKSGSGPRNVHFRAEAENTQKCDLFCFKSMLEKGRRHSFFDTWPPKSLEITYFLKGWRIQAAREQNSKKCESCKIFSALDMGNGKITQKVRNSLKSTISPFPEPLRKPILYWSFFK